MFKITKQTKFLLLGVSVISGISFLIAYIYYDGKNKAEDPRILKSKYFFQEYEDLVKENNFDEALSVLDSIDTIFNRVPGYKTSYEPGIVLNNRGTAYLSKALYKTTDSLEKNIFLSFAKKNLDSCIVLYTNWLTKNEKLLKNELLNNEKPNFLMSDPAFKDRNYNIILNKRIDDLILARHETPRRLSVTYTNLVIVLRHQYKQNEAVECYIKAIKLWKENYTARNNFNVLMGKPPEDRSIIDQLFPPEKNNFN